MKWERIIFAVLGVISVALMVVLLLCSRPVHRLFHPHSQQDVIVDIFKNQNIYNTFVSSKGITVQRLHYRRINLGSLSDCDKDAPVLVAADKAQKIKELLMKPSSYVWDTEVNCIPEYGVLFNFHSDRRTVRVAFCFKCGQLGVFDGEDDSKEGINGVDMFTPMSGQILAICKEIFPNDKEIQALK